MQFIEMMIYLDREELQVNLKIIHRILTGCDILLPSFDEPAIEVKHFENSTTTFYPKLGLKGELRMPDGSNVRKYTVQVMEDLQEIMLKNIEDDTKSILILQDVS